MKAIICAISVLLVMTAMGCGSYKSSSVTPTPIAFVYTVGQGSNSIQASKEIADGELNALPLASFPTSPIPVALALDPSKAFVYVSNSTSNTVSGYTLNHNTGDLTPVGSALPPTPVGSNPGSLGFSSGSKFLFVLNQGTVSPATPATISAFSVDTVRGLLTAVPGSPFTFASVTTPHATSLVVSPTAGFVYVGNSDLGTISVFAIQATGALSEISGSPFTEGTKLAGLTIDPKGQFLFAADSTANKIVSLSLQASGAPTLLGAFTAGTTPVAVAVDSNTAFLYSANQGSNDVSAFAISGGNLTPVSGSPYAAGGPGVVTPPQPAFVAVDATNTFLYVGNQATRTLMGFSIKSSDGTLTAIKNAPFGETVAPTWVLCTK